LTSISFAQNSNNPFEIITRLAPEVQEKIKERKETGLPTNPFDIVRSSSKSSSITSIKPRPTPPSKPPPKVEISEPIAPVILSDDKGYRRFLFITVIVMMILLTLIFTLFRSIIGKVWRAFLNPNILSQLYRERSLVTTIPYTILYGLFFMNAGIFTLLITKYYKIPLANSHFGSLALCVAGILGFFLIRHLLLSLVGYIFPIQKETGTYSFSIQIFNIVLGLLLVPMIWFVAYSPDSLATMLVPAFLILILSIYLFLNLRGLLIANRYVLLHKFHFLLYICAVEIAPLAIMLKLLISGGTV